MTRQLLAACFLAFAGLAQGSPIQFDIQIATSTLNGTSGFVALNLFDGDGLINNQVSIDGFATDGVLGDLTLTGDVSGDLEIGPLLIGDGEFFNEALQAIIFGDTLSFRIGVTGEGPYTPIPDGFALFLLDDGLLPYVTDDPAGADALVAAAIDSASPIPVAFESTFASASISPVQTAPAPPVIVLVGMGLGLLVLTRLRGAEGYLLREERAAH